MSNLVKIAQKDLEKKQYIEKFTNRQIIRSKSIHERKSELLAHVNYKTSCSKCYKILHSLNHQNL